MDEAQTAEGPAEGTGATKVTGELDELEFSPLAPSEEPVQEVIPMVGLYGCR